MKRIDRLLEKLPILGESEIISDLLDKLKGYAKSEPEFRVMLNKVVKEMENSDFVAADKTLSKSDFRYQIGNSALAITNLAKDQRLERMGLKGWGLKPGKHIAYRAGEVSKKAKNGIFFAPTWDEAEQYAGNGREVAKYEITIKKPLVVDRANNGIKELGGEPKDLSRSKNVGKAWMANDSMLMRLLKKSEFDVVVFTRPAPPASKELVVPPHNIKSIKKIS